MSDKDKDISINKIDLEKSKKRIKQFNEDNKIILKELENLYIEEKKKKKLEFKEKEKKYIKNIDEWKEYNHYYDNNSFRLREEVYWEKIKDLTDKIEAEDIGIKKKLDEYDNDYNKAYKNLETNKYKKKEKEDIIELYQNYTKKSKKILESRKNQDTNDFHKMIAKKNNIKDKFKNLHNNIILQEDQIKEYKKLNVKMANEIIEMKTQIQIIKTKNSEELYKINLSKEKLLKEKQRIINENKTYILNLENLYKSKNREFNNLKFIAKAILFQKQINDKFLIDSIDVIKKMINNENNYRETHSENNIDTVELKDKLNFIRILHSKINLGISPSFWSDYKFS